jgi:hypothetical protein
MERNWTTWWSLDRIAGYRGPAVYKIRLCHTDIPASIPRFLGTDTNGIVSIGKTSNMEKRRLQFVRGLQKGRGHSEANLLHILGQHSTLATIYPDHYYEYSFLQIMQPGQENVIEEAQIKAYVRQFGEVPPLNSAIPDRYGMWHVQE